MAYTYAQVEGFWIQAGGPKAVAPIAAAIAMAESSDSNVEQQGQPYATTGWGLWQITPGNSEPNAGTDSQLLNPQANAKAAVEKYEQAGNSFTPWTTFTSGKYLQYLQGNVPASSTGSAPQSATTTSLPGFSFPSEITTFFSDGTAFVDKLMWLAMPSSWVRIAAFLIGLALLLFAIHALVAVGEGAPIMPQLPNIVPVPIPLWPLQGAKLSQKSRNSKATLTSTELPGHLLSIARDWCSMSSRNWELPMSPERRKSNTVGFKRFRQANCSQAILYSRNFRVTMLRQGMLVSMSVTGKFYPQKTLQAASVIRHWLAGVTISSDMEESLALLLAHKPPHSLRRVASLAFRGLAK